MSDLNLAVRILGSPNLELESGGYSLGAETRSRAQVTMRTHTVDSPYVEGAFTVRAVRENVVEQLDVYVEGTTNLELRQRIQVLTDRLRQRTFTIQWDWEGARETWVCFAANLSVEAGQSLMVAKTALVKAQVPRLPAAALAAI